MNFELNQKKFLVTRATRGIGLTIAKVSLSEGSKVAIIARNSTSVDLTLNKLGDEFQMDSILGYS